VLVVIGLLILVHPDAILPAFPPMQMFQLFRLYAEWWLVGLLIVLLLGPIVFYLLGPWKYRREEILGNLSSSSRKLYFKAFCPGLKGTPTFEDYYDSRFGRRRYVVPSIFLLVVSVTAAVWTVASVLVWMHLAADPVGILDPTSAAALSGAFVWVVADLLTRWGFRDLSPANLWWSSWRLVMAVPMAIAVTKIFPVGQEIPIAFLLGSFPTRSISTIARRFARRTLNLGADNDQDTESELQKLQGIDTRIAERFADEGITTILQLAYADPVELTMRCASFSFSFVVDVISQALAWIYVGDNLAKLRLSSLRGAQEIASLIGDLDGDDQSARQLARATLNAAAGVVSVPPASFESTLREIAEDPYTEFLRDVWAAN
jgi:hypothetical protein